MEGGGRAALEGFSYQFDVYIFELVRAWLQLQREQRLQPTVFMECVSDIVEGHPLAGVIVTEVKLRQSSAQVRNALQSFWDIERVADTHVPQLVGRISYRILSAEMELKDVAGSMQRWRPRGYVDAAPDSVLLASLLERVEARVFASPLDETLALLANEINASDPLGVVARWRDELLSAAAGRQEMATVARRMWNDLVALDKETGLRAPSGVYLWTEHDRPPDRVVPGDVLIGQRPRLRHLRDGWFAPRPEIFDALIAQAHDWIERQQLGLDPTQRVPVFWVGGRSGSGKSVALLHLLSRLHKDGHRPLAWLGNNLTALREVLDWSRRLRRLDQRVLVGLDDPYAPGRRGIEEWSRAIASLEAIRNAQDLRELPLLICCGPTEQARRLEQELSDDVVVDVHELPGEAESELHHLQEWFRQRRRDEPPPVGDRNLLMVQLFFEWRTGLPLLEFSRRFRRRIQAVDEELSGAGESCTMESFISRVLAANRLYVGFPVRAIAATLSPRQTDAFEQLRREQHFGEIDDDNAIRRGMWLAHAHLSNAIFDGWYSRESDRAVRAEITADCDRDCLLWGESPPERMAMVWGVAAALDERADQTVASRVEMKTVSPLIRRLYANHTDRGTARLAQWQIPAWVTIRALASGLGLQPDPVDEALDCLRDADLVEPGLRLTCHKLLEYSSSWEPILARKIGRAIVELLEDSFTWREWPPVALDLLGRTADEDFAHSVASWILAHPTSPWVPRLLRHSTRPDRVGEILREVAHRAIRSAGGGRAWAALAEDFLKSPPTHAAVDSALEWARLNHESKYACFVLRKLLERRVEPAHEWSLAWARRWWDTPVASYVLETLLKVTGVTSELGEICRRWVEAGYEDSSHLAQRLIADGPGGLADVNFAVRWLSEHRNHHGWFWVWRAARNRLNEIEAVAGDGGWDEIALSWLRAADPANPGWAGPWLVLWPRAEGDRELNMLGRSWLAAAPHEHPSWGFVWRALWVCSSGDPELVKLAESWLNAAPIEHVSWPLTWWLVYSQLRVAQELGETGQRAVRWLSSVEPGHSLWGEVWKTLWSKAKGDEELVRIGRRWLVADTMQHASWPMVWAALWTSTSERGELTMLAESWLGMVNVQHRSWGYVWSLLFPSLEDRTKLNELGRQWLDAVSPEQPHWGRVWRPLWSEAGGSEELAALGRRWLGAASHDHDSWVHVWMPLWSRSPQDREVIHVTKSWLEAAPLENSSWIRIWTAFQSHSADVEELAAVVRVRLAAMPFVHPVWIPVWNALWSEDQGNEDLLELVRQRLTVVPATDNSWGIVWRTLLSCDAGDDETAALAQRWLTAAPIDDPAWGATWSALWDRQAGRESLRQLGAARLDDSDTDPVVWRSVWKRLWAESGGDSWLASLARAWLQRTPLRQRGWSMTWQQLWLNGHVDDELEGLGRDWLRRQGNLTHASWSYLWQSLWVYRPDSELEQLGLSWLRRASAGHGGRPFVLLKLLSTGFSGAAQLDLAIDWLPGHERHEIWSSLLLCVIKHRPQDERLRDLATRWLSEHAADENAPLISAAVGEANERSAESASPTS